MDQMTAVRMEIKQESAQSSALTVSVGESTRRSLDECVARVEAVVASAQPAVPPTVQSVPPRRHRLD
eukprot:5616528-Prymnesium_polylepis.1